MCGKGLGRKPTNDIGTKLMIEEKGIMTICTKGGGRLLYLIDSEETIGMNEREGHDFD